MTAAAKDRRVSGKRMRTRPWKRGLRRKRRWYDIIVIKITGAVLWFLFCAYDILIYIHGEINGCV